MEDNFFAVYKLVEFGLSMAVAQQMIQTMNQSLNQMQVTGTPNDTSWNHAAFYYVMIDEKQAGPFSEQELIRLIQDKTVTKSSYIWKPGLSNWMLAEQIPEVLKLVVLSPPSFTK